MKRKALIIGNTRGDVGVCKDLLAYQKHLFNEKGGAWATGTDEVIVLRDPTREGVLSCIQRLKQEKLDFFMFIFTGHGGFSRMHNDTLMELSANGEEEIYETEILKVAPRQLNIMDCCRVYFPEAMEKLSMILANRQDSVMMNFSRQHARKVYDDLVMRSCIAQISLYACAIGESASGFHDKGSVFTNALLDLSNFGTNSGIYTVEEAFNHAKFTIVNNPYEDQTPTARLPKCLANQRLPWAIRANKWV